MNLPRLAEIEERFCFLITAPHSEVKNRELSQELAQTQLKEKVSISHTTCAVMQ